MRYEKLHKDSDLLLRSHVVVLIENPLAAIMPRLRNKRDEAIPSNAQPFKYMIQENANANTYLLIQGSLLSVFCSPRIAVEQRCRAYSY